MKTIKKAWILLAVLTLTLLLGTSCRFIGLFAGGPEIGGEENAGGAIKVSIPHLSPVLQQAIGGSKARSLQPGTALSGSKSKAFVTADRVHLVLRDGTSAQVDAWDIYPESDDFSIVEDVRTVPPGMSYSLEVQVFNTDNSPDTPVVEGTAGPFDVVSGETTVVEVICLPAAPITLGENSPSSYGLSAGLFDEDLGIYDIGNEYWFEVVPSTEATRFIAAPDSMTGMVPLLVLFDSEGFYVALSEPTADAPAEINCSTVAGQPYYLMLTNFGSEGSATVWYEPGVAPAGDWTQGTLNNWNDAIWYSFEAVSGGRYYIQWDDSWDGSGSFTADILLAAHMSDQTTPYFDFELDSGYSSPASFQALETGKVWIRICPYDEWGTGTFAFRVYNESGAVVVTYERTDSL